MWVYAIHVTWMSSILVLHCSSTATIVVDPLVKLNYGNGVGYQWTQFAGHHGLSESSSQVDTIKGLDTFPSRWLKPDAKYFSEIPAIKGTNLPDLTWFDNSDNQDTVLSSYPSYLSEFGDDNPDYDMIYCIEGCNWPSYMLPSGGDDYIPFNYSAATSLISKSLEVIYTKKNKKLPQYFEPQNEPWGSKFGDNSLKTRIEFQNYINKKIFKQFGNNKYNRLIVGGPAMDGVGWFKISGSDTLWNQIFVPFIKNGIKEISNIDNHEFFISWHQFSSFSVVNNDKLCPNFYRSGAVSSTMDLVENYLHSVGLLGSGKILISEHGLALDPGDGVMNISNNTYLGYVAADVYLTDLMLYLERPESQFKTNSFYLTGSSAVSSRYPLAIIDDDGNVTPTGEMYYIQSLLKENGGNIINATVDYGSSGHADDIKVFSLHNNVTGEMIIVFKEISWKSDQTIKIEIDNWDLNSNSNLNSQQLESKTQVKLRRIFWDSKTGQFKNYETSKDLSSDGTLSFGLNSGETVAVYGFNYGYDVSSSVTVNGSTSNSKSKSKEKTVCRSRYYGDFNIETMTTKISHTMKIASASNNNFASNFVNGILRIGISWDTQKTGNTNDFDKLKPTQVTFNNINLDLSLQRIDGLNECNEMAWISFEYTIVQNVFNSIPDDDKFDIKIKFAEQIDYVYVATVVAEIYQQC